MSRARIAAAGAGRMGRGIAVAFAYAGHEVDVIDLKARPAGAENATLTAARAEVEATCRLLAELGVISADQVATLTSRVSYIDAAGAPAALAKADIVFEGVPETVEAKREAFALLSEFARPDAILASTTSTILSDTLQELVTPPERFLNCHWLNPAYIVPLVEVSPGAKTDPAVTAALLDVLKAAGKVPVVCKASPGFIVPRLQALVMNEAARLVEEGVATAEDIDKATLYGMGFRFAVLGVLEFIDFGGGDILAYASRYMSEAFDDPRFAAPKIVEDNMAAGRLGLKTRSGFLDYTNMDIEAYRKARLQAFVAQLKHMGAFRPAVA